LGLGSVAAIVCAVTVSRPLYIDRGSLGDQLLTHRYVDSTALRAPWLNLTTELALQTPQFLRDREAFVMDLLRTGHVSRERARSLAHVAVREAYTRKIPPALVLGIMLTENDELKSSARSNVGAVGLMQVAPRPWRGLRRMFGANVSTDSTNLKYGIYILSFVAGKAARADESSLSWRKALLRYNGCVRGTNTKGCGSYPDIVRREVQRSGKSTCPEANFDRCVVQPLWLGRQTVDTAAAPW
jgi:hypothetical protein